MIEKPKVEFKDREITMIFIYNFHSGYVITCTITYILALEAIWKTPQILNLLNFPFTWFNT